MIEVYMRRWMEEKKILKEMKKRRMMKEKMKIGKVIRKNMNGVVI